MKNRKSLVTKETNNEWLGVTRILSKEDKKGQKKITQHRLGPAARKYALS